MAQPYALPTLKSSLQQCSPALCRHFTDGRQRSLQRYRNQLILLFGHLNTQSCAPNAVPCSDGLLGSICLPRPSRTGLRAMAASPLACVLKRVKLKHGLVPAAGKATTTAIRRQLRLSSETVSSLEGPSIDSASSIINRLNALDVSS